MVRPSNKKILKKRLKQRIKKIFYFYIIPLISFFILFIYFFNSEKNLLNLKKIKINNNNLSNKEKKEINDYFIKKLDGYYWNLFSKRNIWFYPEKEILKEINQKFMSYKDIKIKKENEIINIYLKKRKEKYVFLKNTDNLKQYFWVDNEGLIFKKIKNIKNKNIFQINKIIFNLNKNKNIGDKIFSTPKEKNKIELFIKRLKNNFNIELQIIKIDSVYYYFIDKHNKELRFKKNGDFEKMIIMLTKILREKENLLNSKNLKYLFINENIVKICYLDQECAQNIDFKKNDNEN